MYKMSHILHNPFFRYADVKKYASRKSWLTNELAPQRHSRSTSCGEVHKSSLSRVAVLHRILNHWLVEVCYHLLHGELAALCERLAVHTQPLLLVLRYPPQPEEKLLQVLLNVPSRAFRHRQLLE